MKPFQAAAFVFAWLLIGGAYLFDYVQAKQPISRPRGLMIFASFAIAAASAYRWGRVSESAKRAAESTTEIG